MGNRGLLDHLNCQACGKIYPIPERLWFYVTERMEIGAGDYETVGAALGLKAFFPVLPANKVVWLCREPCWREVEDLAKKLVAKLHPADFYLSQLVCPS